jgi:hypothetical protein
MFALAVESALKRTKELIGATLTIGSQGHGLTVIDLTS